MSDQRTRMSDDEWKAALWVAVTEAAIECRRNAKAAADGCSVVAVPDLSINGCAVLVSCRLPAWEDETDT
jgi:hypothetical protein